MKIFHINLLFLRVLCCDTAVLKESNGTAHVPWLLSTCPGLKRHSRDEPKDFMLASDRMLLSGQDLRTDFC